MTCRGAIVELADQDVDPIEEDVIERDRDDRDRQADRGGDQGQADPVRQRLAAGRSHPAAERSNDWMIPTTVPSRPSSGPSVAIALRTRRLRFSSTTSPAAS